MIGRVYQTRDGERWRVVCRWASIPKTPVIHNVLFENVATGLREVRPWYPAPKRVDPAPTSRGGGG